jgi:N-acetylglucosamine-6-sulfatase
MAGGQNRREFVAGASSTVAAFAAGGQAFAITPRNRPNIVVVVVDDMRFDEYGAGGHPYLRTPAIDALGASGATFANAYHTTPLCSPNRACILTGQYAALHGIIDNTSRSIASHRLRTFAQELQRAGYETAHVGKWHMGNDATPRPGYDYWVSFEGQGRTVDPELYEDGRLHRVDGYVTDLLMDRAIAFATRPRSKPFMVYIGHKAIHPDIRQRDDGSLDLSNGQPFIPAPRHQGAYRGQVFRRRPNVGLTAEARANMPIIAEAVDDRTSPANLAAFGEEARDPIVADEIIQTRAEMMLSVDEGVGRMTAALEEAGLRENTVFVLMSDNGYFFGEHGLTHERRLPYEESVKCPLIISHPGAIAPAMSVTPFALAIDIAPTLVDIAGAQIPKRMQGRSLLPLLQKRRVRWRDSFLIEYYTNDTPFPWLATADYRAVRFGSCKYVRWIRHDGAEELYDLATDPYERRNLARDAGQAGTLRRARQKLANLVVESLGLSADGR